ncbi:MAG: alanine racemase, partial [Pseudomonadota bacterium]
GGQDRGRRPGMSAARDPYFHSMEAALRDAGVAGPTLVIDLARLDANLERILTSVHLDMAVRVVAKSLPAPGLLRRVVSKLRATGLMSFNLPMTLQFCEAFPELDHMLGKPLNDAALRAFLAADVPGKDRVQWLADSVARLDEIEGAVAAAGARLRVALEIDVGLRRGGFDPGPDLRAGLEAIKASDRLIFSGLMGYEAHLASVPEMFGWRARAERESDSRYAAAASDVAAVLGDATLKSCVLNVGGSPTFRRYAEKRVVNEVALGSCVVKPSDFDKPGLADLEPAAFIAAPILKSGPTRLPGFAATEGAYRMLNPSRSRSVFIHGGDWRADPVDPPGLRYNGVFGRSPNQEMLNGPASLVAETGDFVFFRPRKSESVFLQFGPLAVLHDGRIDDWWPTVPLSA